MQLARDHWADGRKSATLDWDVALNHQDRAIRKLLATYAGKVAKH
jgi:hypothetical protein